MFFISWNELFILESFYDLLILTFFQKLATI